MKELLVGFLLKEQVVSFLELFSAFWVSVSCCLFIFCIEMWKNVCFFIIIWVFQIILINIYGRIGNHMSRLSSRSTLLASLGFELYIIIMFPSPLGLKMAVSIFFIVYLLWFVIKYNKESKESE